jgi:hypothetical protein
MTAPVRAAVPMSSDLVEYAVWSVAREILGRRDGVTEPSWQLLDELRARLLAGARTALTEEPFEIVEIQGVVLAVGESAWRPFEERLLTQVGEAGAGGSGR